jgi:hypothetical protein
MVVIIWFHPTVFSPYGVIAISMFTRRIQVNFINPYATVGGKRPFAAIA